MYSSNPAVHSWVTLDLNQVFQAVLVGTSWHDGAHTVQSAHDVFRRLVVRSRDAAREELPETPQKYYTFGFKLIFGGSALRKLLPLSPFWDPHIELFNFI